MKTKKSIIAVLLIIAVSFIIIAGNNCLELSSYSIKSDNLPDAFSGYRIAHISDLHNAKIGKENEKLVKMLEDATPDIIVITGDIIDSRRTNIDIALQFLKKAMEIAQCYYVTGNHEERIEEYQGFKQDIKELGVIVLDDEMQEIKKDGEAIALIGVNDPAFDDEYFFKTTAEIMDKALKDFENEKYPYTILLSHRPELFECYLSADVDLVFCGHAHGGQIRLPFIGGLIAPNQGVFPEYDAGVYTDDNTNMVVSRGIGNSLFPFRFNNRPEVVLVELLSMQ